MPYKREDRNIVCVSVVPTPHCCVARSCWRSVVLQAPPLDAKSPRRVASENIYSTDEAGRDACRRGRPRPREGGVGPSGLGLGLGLGGRPRFFSGRTGGGSGLAAWPWNGVKADV